MGNLLGVVGNITAILGVLICLVAGASRVFGGFYLLGYEARTLFLGGIALMVMACLVKLQQLVDSNRP